MFNQIDKSIICLLRSTKYLVDIYQLNGLIESIKFFSQCSSEDQYGLKKPGGEGVLSKIFFLLFVTS